MDGVTLALSNGSGSIVTSGGGYYSLTIPYGWSVQVATSYDNGSFNPSSRDYSNLTSDQGNQDYNWTAPTPVIALQNLTAAPSTDVSSWNPVSLSADSPAPGSWSVRIFNAAGNEVTSAGTLTLSPNPSAVLSATWAPNSYYAATGTHTAQVQVSDGTRSESASVSFSLYNFPLQVTGWHFLNSLGTEITSPKAGEAFYLTLEVRNISNATLPKAFVPLMLSGRFLNAAEVQGLAPSQSVTLTLMGGSLPAGSYAYQCFVWTGPGGTPIAQPATIPVVVIP